MATAPLDIPLVASARDERNLYTWGALVAIFVMFVGFAPTYYLKGAFGTADLTPFRHVHGLVMTAWFALFLVQARLVATGRTRIHRTLGVAGAILAALVVVVGLTLGVAAARAGAAPPGLTPLVFLVLPFGEMFTFATLVTAAILLRRRSDWHKRLMLLATLAMLTPAFARWPVVGPLGPPAYFGAVDLIVIGCIVFDRSKNRRVHPALAGGLAFVVVSQFGRLALSQTPQWTAFAQWVIQ
jgi:hypothetical protein